MFEVTARLKVRPGELDGFKRLAAELMRLTREQDTRTLRYDWFLSADGTECEVREGYVDADGLLEHNAHVRETRDTLFRDYAFGHHMTMYGEPSPALTELMEHMKGHVEYARYSLFQGLGDARGTEGDASLFEATAHLKIRDGMLAEFERQAAELLRRMREADDPPLRYDWFLSADGTECEVREAYRNPDTLLEHQRMVAEAKMKLLRECVESHAMTFYGEPSPTLAGALSSLGATFTTFTLLQGLNADIDVGEEVHA